LIAMGEAIVTAGGPACRRLPGASAAPGRQPMIDDSTAANTMTRKHGKR
jgi:hypothetical protein